MQLAYGDYYHATNEAVLEQVTAKTEFTERMQARFVRRTWSIRGILQVYPGPDQNGQTLLDAAMAQMELAYSVNGLNAAFFLNDGSPGTHYLNSADSIGGVRVVQPPSWEDDGRRAEYSTFRTYRIVLEADFPVVNDGIVLQQESLQFIGGGQKFIHLTTLSGQPQKQIVAQYSPYTARQSGITVGLYGYINPPSPIWPDAIKWDQSNVTNRGPKNLNGTLVDWTTEYEFAFEDASPLMGWPTIF